jgi:hypothetical protein
MEIDRVAMRAPAFTPQDPELWFVLLEAGFANANIALDQTKYNYAITALDPATLQEIRDILVNPPAENRYDYLKAEVTRRLTPSTDRRVRRLLDVEEMGDRTPSAFLRHLRTLGGTVPEDILRTLWMARLPQTAQSVIAAQVGAPLDSLASMADAVVETLTVARPPPAALYQADNDAVRKLREEIEELKLERRTRNRDFVRERRHSRNRFGGSRYNNKSRHNDDYCFFHNTFGARARKCQAPCSFPRNQGNANEGH